MRTWSNKSRSLVPSDEPVIVLTDDGGSGLYEDCRARFTSPEFEVTCDDRHTVWIKRTDGSRSVGLAPWALRRQSLGAALASVAKRIGAPVA